MSINSHIVNDRSSKNDPGDETVETVVSPTNCQMDVLGSSNEEESVKLTTTTPKQIIIMIEQSEKGEQSIKAICRKHGISANTFYRWRKAYSEMSFNKLQRLKELEKKNCRLKRLLAECVIEIKFLKELISKKG